MSTSPTTVWVAPSATAFSCLCEHCLESARLAGASLFEAIQTASLRGAIPVDANVVLVRCSARHELVVRRVERPPGLHADDRQLHIA
jgi:hypothetical protein